MKMVAKLVTVSCGYLCLLSFTFLLVYIPMLLALSKFIDQTFLLWTSIIVTAVFTVLTGRVKVDPDY